MTSSFGPPFIAASPFWGFGLKIYYLELVLRMRLLSTAWLKWEWGLSRLTLFFLVKILSIIEAVQSNVDPHSQCIVSQRFHSKISLDLLMFFKKSFCSILNSQHTLFSDILSQLSLSSLPAPISMGIKVPVEFHSSCRACFQKLEGGFSFHGLFFPSKENGLAREYYRSNSVLICSSRIQ